MDKKVRPGPREIGKTGMVYDPEGMKYILGPLLGVLVAGASIGLFGLRSIDGVFVGTLVGGIAMFFHSRTLKT